MAISLGSIRTLLEPGLMEVTGDYPQIPSKIDKIFAKRKATLAVERIVGTRLLPLPYLKDEGQATRFENNAGQRYTYNLEPQEISLGFAVTRKSIINNQYKTEFKPTALNLANVFRQYQEIAGTNILSNALTYDANIGGDGVALASTAHPVDGGTWANTFTTQASLNEGTLYQAMENVRYFPDEAGLRMMATAKRMLVPIRLEKIAVRLTKTEMRPGTADNDVNALKFVAGGLPEGYEVLDFLTSDFAWFLQTSIEGLVFLEHLPFETSMWVDDVTDNLLVKGYQYYGYFYKNPRCLFMSAPTA